MQGKRMRVDTEGRGKLKIKQQLACTQHKGLWTEIYEIKILFKWELWRCWSWTQGVILHFLIFRLPHYLIFFYNECITSIIKNKNVTYITRYGVITFLNNSLDIITYNKAYNLIVFSIELCNCHISNSRIFHHPKKKSSTHWQSSLFPAAPHNYLPTFYGLAYKLI